MEKTDTRRFQIFFAGASVAFGFPLLIGEILGGIAGTGLSDDFSETLSILYILLHLIGGLLGGALGLAVWSGVLLIGPWILDTMFGNEYRDAYLPLLVYLAPAALSLFAIANRAALLSMEKVKAVFIINLTAYAAYLIALPVLAVRLDVLGAAIAQSVHNGVWVGATGYLIFRTIRTRTTAATSAAVTPEASPKSLPVQDRPWT